MERWRGGGGEKVRWRGGGGKNGEVERRKQKVKLREKRMGLK